MNTTYKTIRQSKKHKGYYLIKNNEGGHYLALKDKDEPGGWLHCGAIMDPEDFEIACDNFKEEMRCEAMLG
jgi:hypothetical protein